MICFQESECKMVSKQSTKDLTLRGWSLLNVVLLVELWVYEIMEGGMPLGLVLENLVFGGRSRASLLFFCI